MVLACLITYRPEYHGALSKISGTQTIALRPLNVAQTTTLIGELLGPDASVLGLTDVIAERARGKPFFAEEIVRDLSERGAIRGTQGSYRLDGEVTDVQVPATLQSAIGARVDRLSVAAKRTLSAAAVIGSRFGPELLAALGIDPAVDELLTGELIDQVGFTPRVEYAFRHPLIRTVAYESQLKADRTELHRRLAAAIEQRESSDENAALIAEHLKAAGDLHAAFTWHMRAGTWLADGSLADTGFDELRDLAAVAGDKVSLAMGDDWVGIDTDRSCPIPGRIAMASELVDLLESIGDARLTVGLLYAAYTAKLQCGEPVESIRLSQRAIDLADGDATMGNLILGSPLVGAIMSRGCARCCLGDPGWRDDVEQSATMARAIDVTLRAVLLVFKYCCCG